MKWTFKNKIVITAFVISFSFTLNADANFKKREDRVNGANRVENVFTNSAPPSHSGPMRIDNPGGTDGGVPDGPSTGGPSGPIGDAIPIVLSLSLIYGIYVLGKKRKEAK